MLFNHLFLQFYLICHFFFFFFLLLFFFFFFVIAEARQTHSVCTQRIFYLLKDKSWVIKYFSKIIFMGDGSKFEPLNKPAITTCHGTMLCQLNIWFQRKQKTKCVEWDTPIFNSIIFF